MTATAEHVLDNPAWHALTSVHVAFASGNDLARRYAADVTPLAAVRSQSLAAYQALAALLAPGETVALFLSAPPIVDAPNFLMEQMVCSAPLPATAQAIDVLSSDDIPAMLELAELTQPGPFRQRTIELGGFRGIRDNGRLVAMAGQRLAPPGYREVSAVCTHPDYRGRGYAEALVTAVVHGIFARNETPFLGVRQDNVNALRLYHKLGFTVRSTQYVAIFQP